jgi:hypothetical protein
MTSGSTWCCARVRAVIEIGLVCALPIACGGRDRIGTSKAGHAGSASDSDAGADAGILGSGTGGTGAGGSGGLAGIAGSGGFGTAGGATGAGGALIGDAAAGGSSNVETTVIPGSYDLVLHGITRSPNSGFPNLTSPSEGASMRVDIRNRAGSFFDAVVTPRWGSPAAFSGFVALSVLPLAGQTEFWDGATGVDDKWTTITLPIGPGHGLLLGSGVTLTGDEMVMESGSSTLSGNGDIVLDHSQPEVTADSTSPNGPDSALLPWDPIVVHAAEPLPADALASDVSLDVNAVNVPLTFDFEPTDPMTSWAGVATARGHATSWDALLHGGTGTLSTSPTALPRDPSGNSLKATSQSLFFLDPGDAVSEVTFTGGKNFAKWGNVTYWAFSNSAKPCQAGDCVQIGPFDHGYCDTPRTGLAVWLAVYVPATAFRVSYRAFTADPGATFDPAFTVEATAPGGAVTSVPVVPSGLSDLGPSGAPLEYATDFLTVDVPFPAGFQIPGTLGVAIYGGRGADGPCGGPANFPVSTAVVIDHIGATG